MDALSPPFPFVRHACWLIGLWAVVFAFAQMFPLWSIAAGALGQQAGWLPFAAVAALLAAAAWGVRRRHRQGELHPVAVVLGGLLAIACLGLVDPDFPAKRIHVAEYAAFAVLVRRYMMGFVGGWWLVAMTAATAGLYGVHDELIQGLLPVRTFGIRDALVNGLAALAGALIAHGLGLFGRGRPVPPMTRGDAVKAATVGAAVVLGIAALLAPLPYYRDLVAPFWIVLPVLVAVPISAAVGEFHDPGLRAAFDVLVTVAAVTAFYPMVPYVTPLVFR